jgi:hypothetical protein
LRKSFKRASARSVCEIFRVNRTAWVRKNTLTKRPNLKHTRYAYKPGIQYPAVAVAICPHVFYGPEDRTLRDHDMVVAEWSKHYVCLGGQIADGGPLLRSNRHIARFASSELQ